MKKLDMGSSKTKQFEHRLSFGRVKVIMSDEEFSLLSDAFKEYTETHGVSFGFVRYLVGGKDND